MVVLIIMVIHFLYREVTAINKVFCKYDYFCQAEEVLDVCRVNTRIPFKALVETTMGILKDIRCDLGHRQYSPPMWVL